MFVQMWPSQHFSVEENKIYFSTNTLNELSSVYKLMVSYCSLQQLVLLTKYYQLLGSLRKSENENTGYRLQKCPLIVVELCVDGPGGGERRERELRALSVLL